MNKRILGALLSLFFITTSLPIAHAVDMPLLVWERGKEQNIVLGGATPQAGWQIKLVRMGSTPVAFQPSSRNSKGFLVYSARLPDDLPLAEYSVYVFGDGSPNGSQVAQVKVVEQINYSIAQIPRDLALILLTLIFLFTTLSTARSAKYRYLSFLKQKTLIESETLLLNKSLPRIAYRPYLLRNGAKRTLRPSIFRFLILHDDTFLHKLSPVAWALLPIFAILIGIQGGLSSHGPAVNIPLYAMVLISIVGIVDSYSGIFAASGFAIGQIIIGQAMSLRAVIILGVLALGWIFPGMGGRFLYFTGQKDFPGLRAKTYKGFRDFFLLLTTSTVVGIFFFTTQILADSLALHARRPHPVNLSITIGVIFGIKALVHQQLDSHISQGPNSNLLVLERFQVITLISPAWIIAIGTSTLFTAYIWALSWGIAILSSTLITFLFASLMVKLDFPRIPLLAKWERNVYIESGVVTLGSLWLFTYVSSLPYQISVKSEILMTMGFLLPLLHVIVSSFREASHQAEQHIA
ncbi:MAG: hypothetical protein WCK72_05320 [Actinomycetes bacterium]